MLLTRETSKHSNTATTLRILCPAGYHVQLAVQNINNLSPNRTVFFSIVHIQFIITNLLSLSLNLLPTFATP